MFSLLTALFLAAEPPRDSAHVVLVATTDLHGHATDWDFIGDRAFAGGIARVATVVDSLRARYPGQVVLVDAGDVLQGDPFATYYARVAPAEPHPVIEAMNLAGYDAATPGNHDFDYGLAFQRRAAGDARFAWVSGNLVATPGDTLVYPAYRVIQRDGVRIAITGFTTTATMARNRSQLGGAMRAAPISSSAGPVLQAMRREADLAVALVHAGLEPEPSSDSATTESTALELASLPVRPDVVVVGDSHRELRDSVVGGVHFVQPKPFGAALSVVHLDLTRDAGGRWRLRRVRAELVSTAATPASELLSQRLGTARDAARAWARTPVGIAIAPMRAAAARVESQPLVEFINGVLRRRARADLAATSVSDLRTGFDGDTIRVAHLLALAPGDPTLTAVRISGVQLRQYLEWSARYFEVDPLGAVHLDRSVSGADFDVVSGASYDVDLREPVGLRIRQLTVRGRPVQPADSFTLALSSSRLGGDGGYAMLRSAPVVYDKGERIADLLANAVRGETPLDPSGYSSAGWRIVPEAADRSARALFGVPARPLPVAARDTILLRVLVTGDLHGAFGSKGAALAGALDSLGSACGCPTLRLDAGDALQGTPLLGETRGRAGVELLGRLGYAAAALGEHDFDWSVGALRERLADAPFPWLAANVVDSASGRRPEWITPYRLLDAAGMAVAVIGYITPDAKRLLPGDKTAGLRIGEGELALHDVLGDVAARRPALTIVLAHAGAVCDSVLCGGEAVRLAEQLEGRGVSLLVAGHSHRMVTTRVAGIPLLEVGAYGEAVGVADLVKTPAGGLDFRVGIQPVGPALRGGDAAFRAALDAYQRRNDSLLAFPIAQLKRPLVREGTQYPLGALVAEARRNALRTDLGLVPTATLRADLPAGAATYARLTAVEPNGRDLVRMTVTGTQLGSVLERALADGAPAVHLAGGQVRFDPRAPAGKRLRSVTLRGGRKIRPGDQITLATDEATAQGAGGLAPLESLPYQRGGMLDVEAVAGLLRRLPQPVEVAPPAGFVSTRR